MKNNQRRNLHPNDPTDHEEQLAQATINVLETHQEGQLSGDELPVFELGNLIRQSHNDGLPESNPELRQMLLDEIESGDNDAVVKPVSSLEKVTLKQVNGRGFSSRRIFAVAVALMLALGVTFFLWNPVTTSLAGNWGKNADSVAGDASWEQVPAASRDGSSSAQPSSDSQSDTAMLPVTRSRIENRTRNVPVTRLRTETITERLADGSTVEKQVEVPYTENVTQNYSVQVPYTETIPLEPSAPKDAGLTIDLPKISQSSVNTVVSVPDGGTVLTGGIKRGSAGESRGDVGLSRELAGTTNPGSQAMTREYGVQDSSSSRSLATNGGEMGMGDTSMGMGMGMAFSDPMSAGGYDTTGLDRSKKPSTSLGLYEEQFARNDLDVVEGFGNIGRGIDDPFRLSQWKSEGENVDFDESRDGESRRHRLRDLDSRRNTEQYIPIHENEFMAAIGAAAVSTFSIDVDTAAYANMRRFINSGQLPPRDSVRIEELVNYFQYDYPQPTGDDPFSVNMELASCPWNASHRLLRVGLKGKDIHVAERPPTNVVFLLDVSGSMNSNDKLPLLKRGFQMMVNELTENDMVSIVTYAGNAGVVLEPISGDQKSKINGAIESLTPGGSTHGSAGIELAYKLAQQKFITGGANKVILATDGDLNVGVTEDSALVNLIKQKASEGVFLTVLGFGTGNLKDGKMEQLADNGNGLYAYIDSIREAKKVLVEQLSGSLVTIAKDVKIQIEFNPAEVKSYRLIGYENRMLATRDFDDDQKDAGEIGAGHTVTALYELVTTDATSTLNPTLPSELKYQSKPAVEPKPEMDSVAGLSSAAESGELLTLALRYKQPDSNTSKRIEFTINNEEKSFASASDDFRFASSVASFGMLLRGSKHAGNATPNTVQDIASGAMGDDRSGIRAEFIDLVRKTAGWKK